MFFKKKICSATHSLKKIVLHSIHMLTWVFYLYYLNPTVKEQAFFLQIEEVYFNIWGNSP